jgi:excisionase family DNA binding protein
MSRTDRKRGDVVEHLSLAEASERLGISERTARRWIKSGKLRASKPGRDYWIPESALTELVEESEVRPKAERRSSLEPSLFNGLEDERRSKLEEAERAVHYITERAEWYEQELEGERVLGPKTATKAADRAYILAVLAIEEFSSFVRWFFDVVARDLVREIEAGNASELVDEFDSLEETLIKRISHTQRMLLGNAKGLAKAEDQREGLARLRKAGDTNIRIRRHSA